MAYTTINKSTENFNTTLHTGNGSTQSITGVGFQPDLTWIKRRSADGWHWLTDAVRGTTKTIYSNSTTAEETNTNGLTAFGTDGFTVGSNADINGNTQTHVAWNWKANGAGSSNTDGTITSTVSVNTTAGFSVVKYVSNGTAGATVGHGLGVAPKMVIAFNLAGEDNWGIGHSGLTSWDYYLQFGTNAQSNAQNVWNDTAPSSSVVTLGDNGRSNSSNNRNYIMYCFAEKTGYSKFGSVNGNGNADGPFVYTGFAPSFVLYKKYNGLGDWYFVDNKRPGYNDNDKRLYANTNQAEETYDLINLYSNGFKLTNSTHTYTNDSAGTYLYMAFGQSLVGSNNVPCTAR